MSIGYDLAGIQTPKVVDFIRGMIDARESVDRLRDQIPRWLAPLRDLDYPDRAEPQHHAFDVPRLPGRRDRADLRVPAHRARRPRHREDEPADARPGAARAPAVRRDGLHRPPREREGVHLRPAVRRVARNLRPAVATWPHRAACNSAPSSPTRWKSKTIATSSSRPKRSCTCPARRCT